MTPPELVEHPPAAREAIAAELVACTLGARSRRELRTDLPRLSPELYEAFRRLGERIAKAMAGVNARGRLIGGQTDPVRRAR